jgi:hypothetical protein
MRPGGESRVAAALIAAVVALAGPRVAAAQSAEAEALFLEGRTLIKQGKIAEGCAKLEASDRLESSVGTLLNLGDCYERLGQTASAWAAFKKAEAMARRKNGDEKRGDEAKKRAIQLAPRLPNLTIAVPHAVDGIVVRRGSVTVDRGEWNTSLPVDPGSYAIVAEAPGYKPWRTEIRVEPAARRDVVVPALERAPLPSVPPTAVAISASAEPPSMWTTPRAVAAGLAVGAGAAFGYGIYSGIRADDLRTRSDTLCPLDTCSDPVALRLNSDARSAATRANWAFVAGGAAAVTSAILWFAGAPSPLDKKEKKGRRVVVAPEIGLTSGGLVVSGTL